MTAPGVRMSRSRPMPMASRMLLMMPVSCNSPTHARVRSRKLMHMGSITSIYRNFWAVWLRWAM